MKAMHYSQLSTQRRRAPRGSALVVSLVVIFAMTGLGIIAYTTAVTALRTSTFFTLSKQTNFVAEVAMMASTEELACTQQARIDLISAEGSSTWTDKYALCGLGTTGTVMPSQPFGERAAVPSFNVVFDDVTLGRRAQGYDTGACFLRVRVQSTGEVVLQSISSRIDNDQSAATTLRRRALGYMYVGPIVNPSLCGEG